MTTQITGSVRELCAAAAEECRAMGYEAVILTDQLCCEAREAGSFLASILRTHAGNGRPVASSILDAPFHKYDSFLVLSFSPLVIRLPPVWYSVPMTIIQLFSSLVTYVYLGFHIFLQISQDLLHSDNRLLLDISPCQIAFYSSLT